MSIDVVVGKIGSNYQVKFKQEIGNDFALVYKKMEHVALICSRYEPDSIELHLLDEDKAEFWNRYHGRKGE